MKLTPEDHVSTTQQQDNETTMKTDNGATSTNQGQALFPEGPEIKSSGFIPSNQPYINPPTPDLNAAEEKAEREKIGGAN